jgi:hypothetical protein
VRVPNTIARQRPQQAQVQAQQIPSPENIIMAAALVHENSQRQRSLANKQSEQE